MFLYQKKSKNKKRTLVTFLYQKEK